MNRRFDRLPRAAAAACAILLLLSHTTGRAAQLLSGSVPKAVLGLRPLRHYDGANRLSLAIGLPLRDSAGLDTFLREVYDPASPLYRHFLTSQQFADRFGPTVADYESLKKFAQANHLAITGTHPNRTLLDVEGSVADIENALHVSMQVYQHPTEKRTFIAPNTDPWLDCPVRVLHIAGLDNYFMPHPNYVRHPRTRPAATPALGSGPDGTYAGFDFRSAYAPGVNLDGTGQSVGLFELDAYFPNDPVTYEQDTGLPNVTLTNVSIDGFAAPPGANNVEVSLDIEMAIAMAPGLSSVIIYEATNTGFININDDMLNRMATDDKANQLSASWTYGIDATSQQIYLQMAAQGQSFFNAAGDSGAYPPGQIRTPADDTNITIVGGTTLFTTGPGGAWQNEVVWSDFTQGTGFAAGSGGFSSTYALPPWQQGISMVNNHGSTTFRNLPDVALTADNIFIVADNGVPQPVGGTSAATPLWAAFTSLVNEQGISKGRSPVGFLNPTLYALGKGPLYTTAFHDIIEGNNTNFVSPILFSAVVGYDLCTGWGTPNGSNMINYLAPLTAAPILAIATNIISGGNGNGVIDFDECDNLTVVLTNEGNATATVIQGILTSLTPGVIVAEPNATFPDLAPRQAAVGVNNFTISTLPTFVCGTPVNLQLVVKCAEVIQTNSILLPSGILGTPDTFSSIATMVIPPNDPIGINSPIAVTGLETESVGQITVSTYISALFDEGLTLKLIAPNGVSVLLSQFNGTQGSGYGVNCSPGGETTFDDTAALPITLGNPPYVGSFQPQQPLAAFNLFNGTNLNGIWQLSVVDSFPGDTAQLNCWSLNISPYVCSDGGGECPGSDLSLTMTAAPNPVLVESNVVYTMLVSNAGPSIAENVVVAQALPPGFLFVTASNYPVSASQSGSTLNLNIGTMQVYGSALIYVVTTPTIPGLATSVATVGSPAVDPNPNNNTASATVQVTLPGADLGVTMTASPRFVLQGSPLTYTITVTNNGPFTATLVTLKNTLPPNANLLSATTSQGFISADGTLADIGTLDLGFNAVVTLVVSPTTTGNVTASSTASLGPLETDPNLLNNTASATVTVGPSADLSVTGFFSPPTILSGAAFTNIATLLNAGPSAATGVVFSQTIPAGASFISSSASGVTVTNGVVSWTVGGMADGGSVSITNVFQAPTLLSGIASQLLSSTLTVFGQPGDPDTNNNVVTLQALVEPPTITITPVNAVLISGGSGGAVAPGDTVQVQFNLQNTGNINTTNVIAVLQSSGGVSLPSPTLVSYGALNAGAPPVGGQFSFTANGTNGGTVVATLQLSDGSFNLGTVAFTFYMPVITTFWNTNLIDIPARAYLPEPAEGPASPYPSQLTVSNVTGFVSDVTVTFSNLSHTYPHDIATLLVGPTGQASALMVNAGDFPPVGMVDQTLVFDQNASTVLPQFGQIVSGTYQPADYTPSYSFTNAPAGPYTADLSIFSGLPPNGTWFLYAFDTAADDSGGITNGWAVTITTIVPINQEADMAASIVASANQVTVGGGVTLLLSATNHGPNAATAYLTNVLSGGLSFVSTSAPQTNYTRNGQVILYTLGTLQPGAGVTITNVVMSTASGAQSDTITAASTLPDPNSANDSASAAITVNMPFAVVAAGISAAPNPAVVNNNLAYTLVVTNLGPGNALSVTGSFSLNGLNFASASPSQGSAIFSSGGVQCNFGSLPAGQIATVVVTALPAAAGLLTNIWTVNTTDQDTNVAAGTVTSVVTVNNPAPFIVAGGVALVSQGGGFSNGAVNSGETVTVAFSLNNAGTASTANLIATLQGNANLTPLTASQDYGAILPGTTATQPFAFTAQGLPGAAVVAVLSLTDGASSLGSVTNVFLIPGSTNFSQTSEIIIPEYGPGVPYPSQIQVSGLPGLVYGVTATLNGFSHTFPHDVNVLLASPGGQEFFLMSHDGGAYSVTNLTLTFSDSATQTLPAGQMSSGTYLPTAVTPLNPLPGLSAAPSESSLSYFNGIIPNGYWSLYVFDDTEGNAGVITRGWSLGLTTVSPVNPAARLEAGMVHSPPEVFGGNFLNYLIAITNLGPDEATAVVLTDPLPGGMTYASTTLSQGTSTATNGTVTWNIGNLAPGATATADIRVIAGAPGAIVNTATVATGSIDLYLADSTTVNTTTVLTPTISVLEATNYPSGLQLTLLGQSSQAYAIQVSTDLISWTSLSTNTASPTGKFIFTDTGTNLPARFYRAIRLPQ